MQYAPELIEVTKGHFVAEHDPGVPACTRRVTWERGPSPRRSFGRAGGHLVRYTGTARFLARLWRCGAEWRAWKPAVPVIIRFSTLPADTPHARW
jgi:hypothetical protein